MEHAPDRRQTRPRQVIAAGDLHRALARQRIAGHVLADSPDLRQKVLVAVPVEHQAAVLRGCTSVVRERVHNCRVLAIDTGNANRALRG